MVSVNVLLFVVPHAIHVTNPYPYPNPNPHPKLNPKPVPSPNPNPNPSRNQGLYEIRLTRRLGGGVRKKRELFEDLFIALAACGWYVTPALIIHTCIREPRDADPSSRTLTCRARVT